MPIVRNGRDQAAAEGQRLAGTASQQGQEVVSVASGQGREVAGAVREQATQLTHDLSGQGRELIYETRRQVEDEAQSQTQALAEVLHRWGQETQALVGGRPEESGSVGEYARQVSDKLHDLAYGIEERGLDGLIEEVQDFGRKRPGAFLLGAAVIGFGGGRLLRSGSSGGGDEAVSGNGTSTARSQVTPRRSRATAGTDRQLVAARAGQRRNPPASGGE